MPTHFRWVWYLVGLAGMALTILGIIAILGSAADLGILIPLVVIVAIVVGYALIRFRRSLDAALAEAPSRRPGATPAPGGRRARVERHDADGRRRGIGRRRTGRGPRRDAGPRQAQGEPRSDQPPLTRRPEGGHGPRLLSDP